MKLPFVFAFCVATSLCFAAAPDERAVLFDIKPPAGLDADERDAAALHAASAVIRALDKNHDGLPDLSSAADAKQIADNEKKEHNDEYFMRKVALDRVAGTSGIASLKDADNQLKNSDI